ncbi:hypothetical protein [Streptomyces flaveolus]|uniref:hypothetical protein n=1 Tax=Streptomyces flaveolus TaxID=67297 RepID=UPI0036FE79E2
MSGLVDVLLLAVELLIGVATGAGLAWTTRIGTAADGAVWSRGSRAGSAVWTAGIALRAALGVRQDTSALLLALAATLLARSGTLARRAQAPGRAVVTRAAGDVVPRLARKEPA